MVVEATIQTINAGCSIDGVATPMTNVGIPVIEDTVPTIGADSSIIVRHTLAAVANSPVTGVIVPIVQSPDRWH